MSTALTLYNLPAICLYLNCHELRSTVFLESRLHRYDVPDCPVLPPVNTQIQVVMF